MYSYLAYFLLILVSVSLYLAEMAPFIYIYIYIYVSALALVREAVSRPPPVVASLRPSLARSSWEQRDASTANGTSLARRNGRGRTKDQRKAVEGTVSGLAHLQWKAVEGTV